MKHSYNSPEAREGMQHHERMKHGKSQSKASRMDESLGERRGKESGKSQSYSSRRHESMGDRHPEHTLGHGLGHKHHHIAHAHGSKK